MASALWMDTKCSNVCGICTLFLGFVCARGWAIFLLHKGSRGLVWCGSHSNKHSDTCRIDRNKVVATLIKAHANWSLNVGALIVKTDGWRGLYRGLGITILRDAPAQTVYFGSLHGSRELISTLCSSPSLSPSLDDDGAALQGMELLSNFFH